MDAPPQRVVILVVEDDPRVRELMYDILTDEGYEVMAAENGEQALTTVGTVWPALITLDLDLPDTTGALVLAELRRRDQARELPVLIISAKEPIPPEVRDMAQAIISKPFEIDDLLAIVRRSVPPPTASDGAKIPL